MEASLIQSDVGSLQNFVADFSVDACQACNKCVSVCSWRNETGAPNPRQLVRLAALGMEEELAKSPMLWTCMACGRCAVACPMGIDIGNMVRMARSLPGAMASVPEDYHRGLPLRLEHGNVNGVTKEDYLDTLDWLNEELQMESGDESAVIPVDVKNAKYLYVPNPREIDLIPMHLMAMLRILRATGETYTLSSDISDVTNWAYFLGNDTLGRRILERTVAPIEALGVDTVVLSECGHGLIVMKKFIEPWLGRKPKFKIKSIIELTLEGVENGLFRMDPTKTDEPVAYHDPCKVGRVAGLFDPPRKLLASACKEVVELNANRMHSLCCGGGGGLLQDSGSKDKRMLAGRAKAEQMLEAGTKIVATSCLSCHRQLTELAKEYKTGQTVTTVASLAAKALVEA